MTAAPTTTTGPGAQAPDVADLQQRVEDLDEQTATLGNQHREKEAERDNARRELEIALRPTDTDPMRDLMWFAKRPDRQWRIRDLEPTDRFAEPIPEWAKAIIITPGHPQVSVLDQTAAETLAEMPELAAQYKWVKTVDDYLGPLFADYTEEWKRLTWAD
jgi:hypothetical protein